MVMQPSISCYWQLLLFLPRVDEASSSRWNSTDNFLLVGDTFAASLAALDEFEGSLLSHPQTLLGCY
jgi:hypothetical protein